MKDSPTQLALREWRGQMRHPRVWGILVAVAFALAILGPFGLNERLTPPGRVAYWFAVSAGSYGAGLLVNLWFDRVLRLGLPLPVHLALVSVTIGAAILPLILAANWLSFGYWPDLADWPILLTQIFGLSLIVSVVFHLVSPAPEAAEEAAPPALWSRLPAQKRGALLSLSSQDHYTEIRTVAGTELVLIRLADAIAEAAPTEGLKVHRSHWVARMAITKARKDGDRAILTLSDGTEIPVSRANVATIREAGFL